jgi:DNA polymerase-1
MLRQSSPPSLHNKIVVVDLPYLIHRSYKAGGIAPTVSPHPDSASEVAFRTAERLRRDLKPLEMHFAVEAGHAHRDKLLPTYKNRPDKDEDLVSEIDTAIEMFVTAGHSVLFAEGFEADDVIATMAYRHRRECMVITADKDLHQLAEVCHIYHPYDREEVTVDDVVRRWGVPPSALGDVLAMNGDKADHIPGIDRIGEKTAAKLIKEHGSLEDILEISDEMAEKTGKVIWKNIAKSKEQARTSRNLVQLILHVDIEQVTINHCPWSQRTAAAH